MRISLCRSVVRMIGWSSCLLLAAPTFAQESEADSSGDWFKNIFSTSGEYVAEITYVGEASVQRSNKEVQDYDESDVILQLVLTPRVKLGVLRLGVQWERFSFGLPQHAPLPNTLQSGALVLGLDTQLSDSILFRFEAQPGFYGTTDFTSDNFSVPFLAGGTYIYNPNLQFIAGVSVDVERKYPVIPSAGIRWRFARQWVANVVLPAPRIEYELNKSVTLYAGGLFKETNFRVPQDFGNTHGGNTSLNGAVLTYSEVRTGVGADWKLTSVLTVSGEVGYQPYRSFDYYRANIRFHENGSAPYGTFSVHGSF
jgi:Domain of unknown function (DUF6268)